jgi:hypothetical protein
MGAGVMWLVIDVVVRRGGGEGVGPGSSRGRGGCGGCAEGACALGHRGHRGSCAAGAQAERRRMLEAAVGVGERWGSSAEVVESKLWRVVDGRRRAQGGGSYTPSVRVPVCAGWLDPA